MRAQLIKVRLKPGQDTAGLKEQSRATGSPDTGLLQTMVIPDHKHPGQLYALVMSESEEKAPGRERDEPELVPVHSS